MRWPTAQMRHFLCSCFIDRPGSLSPFFLHRVCTVCRRICAQGDRFFFIIGQGDSGSQCDRVLSVAQQCDRVHSVTNSGVLLKCGCGIMSR